MVIFHFFLDLIFPKFCLGCGKEGIWLCPKCQAKILPVKTQLCPGCGRISPRQRRGKYFGIYCQNCRRKYRPKLKGIIVAAYYVEGPIKELIHNFKYNHILELETILGDLLAKSLKDNLKSERDVIVTAVPLHFLRRAQRGYNQSEILARYVANKLKMPKNFQIIKKIRQTKPQVKLGGKKRLENLKNCYKIINKNIVRGQTIILVDDVTTTGTTLNECAKVLREAGAKGIWGLVVAKG